jgi:hypothetical protein
MGAITKFIVTTGKEIFGATDSTEGKHFKSVFQYLSILSNSIIFKLLPFSSFHAECYIKLTIRHKVRFMQYIQFCAQHHLQMFHKCLVFVMERTDTVLLRRNSTDIFVVEVRNLTIVTCKFFKRTA